MKIWDWIARHGGGVQRRQDWVHLLGNLFSDWEPLLKKVPKPSDIRFWAQLGGGEEEYVVHQERLWFWNLIAPSAPRIVPQDSQAQVRMERRMERQPMLY